MDADQAEAAVGGGVGDGEHGDLRRTVFHDARGFAERHRRVGAHGVDRHDVGGAGGVDVDAAAERTPEIAVGDETGERAVGREDAGGAVRMAGHRDDRIAQGVGRLGAGAAVERLERFADREREIAAQLAGGMKAREVVRAEAALRHQGGGERVAEREREERARRGHQAERVGFRAGADVEDHVGLGRQRRLRVADDRDDGRLEGAQHRDEADELGGRARAREKDDRVAGLQDAEVAVHRVGGVEEDGGRARAAERRGDLLADETGLADAAEHHLALMGGEQVDGLREGTVEARGEFGERGGFGLEQGAGGVEGSSHVKRREYRV